MDMQTANILIFVTLEEALSQNPNVLKLAETKLQELEIQPGFHTILVNIILDHSLPQNVRWMAAVYLKNGINKYWRKNAPNNVSEDEKAALRPRLISNFHEPVNQIANTLAVAISRIARMDCPHDWPDLVPTLLKEIEGDHSLTQHRALLIFHQVTKALASKRLLPDKKLFQQYTSTIYPFILNIWLKYSDEYIQNINNHFSEEIIIEKLEKALLTLRILRKTTIFGFNNPDESSEITFFMNSIFEKTKLSLEKRILLSGQLLELCEKYIIHLTKVLYDFLNTIPKSFVNFIQPTLELTTFYLFSDEGSQFLFERFMIQCFNLLKSILLYKGYKLDRIRYFDRLSRKDKNYPELVCANEIKEKFFQPNILTHICQKMILHYLLLKQEDLELWNDDSENFAADESGESWKYNLRPCIEMCFDTLFRSFSNQLSPMLLDMVNQLNNSKPSYDMQTILQKDAIYTAVGLASYAICDQINIDEWFPKLIEELKIKTNEYRIIRRRVIWMIGNWIQIHLSIHLRPLLYETILELLQSNEDMAVRLAAINTLHQATEDFDFDCDQFSPFLDLTYKCLFSLLKETRECETKMQILNLMSDLISRMGNLIEMHAETLIDYLPALWDEFQNQNMLLVAIVSTLVQIVKHFNTPGRLLINFLIPIIKFGTDINEKASIYLIEECLTLWVVVLETATELCDELISLFKQLPNILENTTENFRLCFQIAQAHLLLLPDYLLKDNCLPLINVIDSSLADLHEDAINTVLRFIELLLRANPGVALDIARPIFPKIVNEICKDEFLPTTIVLCLCISARQLLTSLDSFVDTINKLSSINNETVNNITNIFITNWLVRMPFATKLEHTKLFALALSNLLTSQNSIIMQHFSKIITRIVGALHEICKTDECDKLVDTLVCSDNDENLTEELYEMINFELTDSQHEERLRQLIKNDPVYSIELRNYFKSQMEVLHQQLGVHNMNQLMMTLDKETIDQMNKFI